MSLPFWDDLSPPYWNELAYGVIVVGFIVGLIQLGPFLIQVLGVIVISSIAALILSLPIAAVVAFIQYGAINQDGFLTVLPFVWVVVVIAALLLALGL